MSSDSTADRWGHIVFIPVGDGSYVPKLRLLPQEIALHSLPGIGIHIQPSTVDRLIAAGLIKTSGGLISTASLLSHIEEAKKPGFWSKKRRVEYRKRNRQPAQVG
jgi:hypothetical protein